mmetsp:Transcript_56356/g.123475  ORF Transcript_56356/g.123475 Transcript_56356/m.123475 type:complete len:372 (-) Transcript_56356:169-1284(-)
MRTILVAVLAVLSVELNGVVLVATPNEIKHRKAAGDGYERGSPLYRKQQSKTEATSTAFPTVGTLEASPFESRSTDPGNLVCMRQTGLACEDCAGASQCINGKCYCREGFCADATGHCSDTKGKWVGEFAVRFENAFSSEYLGAEKRSSAGFRAQDGRFPRSSGDPVAVANDMRRTQWRVAATNAGNVRFESLQFPGYVLALWSAREGEPQPDMKKGQFVPPPHKSDELWPAIVPFEVATPAQVSFQLLTGQDGITIWDPTHHVAIAAVKPGEGDPAAQVGVGECKPSNSVSRRADGWTRKRGCDGHQFTKFVPDIPSQYLQHIHQDSSVAESLKWWHYLLIAIVLLAAVVGSYFMFRSFRKQQKPSEPPI